MQGVYECPLADRQELLRCGADPARKVAHIEEESLAPRARFELATLRLTAECSAVELPGNTEAGI